MVDDICNRALATKDTTELRALLAVLLLKLDE